MTEYKETDVLLRPIELEILDIEEETVCAFGLTLNITKTRYYLENNPNFEPIEKYEISVLKFGQETREQSRIPF